MKITEILSQEKPVLSFEVFPPKKESAYETVEQAAVEIARLSPVSYTHLGRDHHGGYRLYGGPAETDRGAAPLHVAPLRVLCKEQRKEGKPVKQERKGENICIQIK